MTEEDEARVLETLSDLPMVDNILEALERPGEKKDNPLDDTLESEDALTPRFVFFAFFYVKFNLMSVSALKNNFKTSYCYLFPHLIHSDIDNSLFCFV